MIQTTIIGTDAVIAHLQAVSPRVTKQVRLAIERLTARLQRLVKENYLSGDPLRVQTGTLRRSINRRVDEDGDSITGTVGTNVVYAPVHEYGGVFSIPAHIARRRSQIGSRSLKRALNRVYAISWEVRAHTARFPQRAFMAPALASLQVEIHDRLAEAVGDAIHGAGGA